MPQLHLLLIVSLFARFSVPFQGCSLCRQQRHRHRHRHEGINWNHVDPDRPSPRRKRYVSTQRASSTIQPDPENARFGRRDYWNSFYQSSSSFSWYAGWEDLQPFVDEFFDESSHVLIPGVGNDAMVVEMYDAGYRRLTAMDYAPEGIERCREMLTEERLRRSDEGVALVVADARDLSGDFGDSEFDGVIEKGTLDAIYLSGGDDKTVALQHLQLAVQELGRTVKPGGVWMSIAAVVDDEIYHTMENEGEWELLVGKDDLYMTEDGYTSNNIDGNLMVWRKTG